MQIADRDRPAVSARPPRHIASRGVLVALLALLAAFASQGTSPAHAEPCPNEALRTGLSARLPDCRAYEQVSPPFKNSGALYQSGVGTGEETFRFASIAGFGDPQASEGAPGFVYTSERGAGGWATSSLAPSSTRFLNLFTSSGNAGGRSGPVAGRSGDLRTVVWVLHEVSQPDNQAGLYVTRPGQPIVEMGPTTPPGAAPVIREGSTVITPTSFQIQGVSADASHVVFNMGEAGSEWSFGDEHGVGGPKSLLEYIGTGNTVPIPVGVEDDGGPVEGCSDQILGGQLREQEELKGSSLQVWTHNAMSLDGKTIFFTAMCNRQIFARIDNGEAGAHTVAISEPSKEDCSACETFEGEPGKRSSAYFVGASEDGSKVFFATEQPLLDGGVREEDIYEYDFDAPAGERIVRLSGGDGTVSDPVANVQGVMQVSEDGSHVYFVASGVLTANPNGRGQKAVGGEPNLYVVDTETGTTVFVATLAPNDAELWLGYSGARFPINSDLTPDGRFLVFPSHAHLTPDDTSTAAQIFEYDAQTGVMTRVSIGEDGYNDDGNTYLQHEGSYTESEVAAQDVSLLDPTDAKLSETTSEYAGRYSAAAYTKELDVSANGEYVFFQSHDGLTPQALNDLRIYPFGEEEQEDQFGPLYAQNVYEYHAGNVYLISDGQDATSIYNRSSVALSGTDPSGRDVFFTTTDQLVAQDTDTQLDIYDARIDGGFPAPTATPECQADACQGPLSGVPTLLSPGSEFQAGGNPPLADSEAAATPKPKAKAKPKKCKPGTKRKHGKCQKAKAKKSSRDRRAR
jgi:hypothetical protein